MDIVARPNVPFGKGGLDALSSMHRNFNISLLFSLKAQVQKSVKTAMDGIFRNFGKVSQDGLTCYDGGVLPFMCHLHWRSLPVLLKP